MISRTDLRRLARARLADSEVLFTKGRYDGAVYLSGYAIEVALKARICRTLKWSEFPSSKKEFEPYRSLRTHDLDVLLRLSGIENRIKTKNLTEWSIIATWDPEVRYKSTKAKHQDALSMIEAVKTLLKIL
jgi:HEPN domain-containing protein